jgi:hypothetical protein
MLKILLYAYFVRVTSSREIPRDLSQADGKLGVDG